MDRATLSLALLLLLLPPVAGRAEDRPSHSTPPHHAAAHHDAHQGARGHADHDTAERVHPPARVRLVSRVPMLRPAPPPPAVLPDVAPAPPPEPAKGSNSGLPLPRFASLKTDEVNLRSGPGLRYPIEWVYKRRELPVQIEREFESWRLISDQEGVKGWVHQATLVGRRTFVVTGGERTIRADANEQADALAQLKPGVIGRIRACEATAGWCQVQVGDYRGWLKRDAFWGLNPGEAIQ